MKKILTLLASIAAGTALLAGPVGQDKALKAARGFFADTKSADLTLVWDGESAGTKTGSGEPAFYVYNRAGGGFVIISGEDKVQPILGYSRSGSFVTEGMPENIAGWMSDVRSAVLLARDDSSLKTMDGWEEEAGAPADAVVYYETALWSQGAPYNSKCPKIFGDATLTGCVATALAIVMRYWKWPDAGAGTLPGYSYVDDNGNTQNVSSITLGNLYAWDNMPLTNLAKGGASDVQKAQVAQLMYDCGVMMQMKFDTDGSSAVLADIVETLPKYMKYDKALGMEQARHYAATSWISVVKKGLDEGPLLYSGQGDNAGHAFVLTGYDSSDRFYINWGWGGKDNGYFAYPGIGKYVTSNKAYPGVRPDQGGKGEAKLIAESLSSSTTTYAKGLSFVVKATNVWNYGSENFSGQMAIGKLASDGTLEIISTAKTYSNLAFRHGWSTLPFNCSIESEIKDGDKIGMFYQIDGQTQWRSVLYDLEKGGGMIAIDGLDDISKRTSVVYVVATKTLRISSREGVDIRLEKEDGSVLKSGVGSLEVQGPASGSYRLVLSYGDLKKTIEIVL